MTDYPPMAGRLTRHQYRETFGQYSDKAMQDHAELEGHVPPGVAPVNVSWFGERSRDVVWEWITGEDSTGQLKEMWCADGPWAGRPRMVEADITVGALVAFPNFGPGFQELDEDGNLNPMDIRYRLEQRADGLWFGRWTR
jgi:hypothetical protein